MKIKLPIADGLFAHCYTTSDRPSDRMEWERENLDEYEFIFLTDDSLHLLNDFSLKRKYAWLVESPEITAGSYNWLIQNHQSFNKIFTFKKDILESIDSSYFLPIGGCWINEEDRGLHIGSKTKNLSMIASSKNWTTGHKIRHQIINSDLKNSFDLYGREFNPIVNKITALKDYRFQIVIENNKSDYYFTEKLIDCLQTGVIPIYWGCPSISNFFDKRGMIEFNDFSELYDIIPKLNQDLYNSKVKYVLNNLELSKKYTVSEHYLIENYSHIL